MIARVAAYLLRILLKLRYRVKVTGLDSIPAGPGQSLLFLPNHPALIDPVIVLSQIYPKFRCIPLAKENELNVPVIKQLARKAETITIGNINSSRQAAKEAERVIQKVAEKLNSGRNVYLYPAGKLYRSSNENIGANSAVEYLLKNCPNVKPVVIRTSGLWGSSFSFASGESPDAKSIVKKAFGILLKNLIFFSPKRKVEIEIQPADFLSTDDDRLTVNRKLEEFYNKVSTPAIYVPYSRFNKEKKHFMKEAEQTSSFNISKIPPSVRAQIKTYLHELSGIEVTSDNMNLAAELGLDSLAVTDAVLWIEREFGHQVPTLDNIRTVADIMLAACGEIAGADSSGTKQAVPPQWFKTKGSTNKIDGKFETLTELFLDYATSNKSKVIISDSISGCKNFRQFLTGIIFFRSLFAKSKQKNVGIMLPACNAAIISYWAALFTGKTPAMFNWTSGCRNLAHAIRLTETDTIITSKKLINQIAVTSPEIDTFSDKFVFLEDIAKSTGLFTKLKLAIKSLFPNSILRTNNVSPNETAAILFTSGSEALPKAVPLTHKNLIANMKDLQQVISFTEKDRLCGILPPFHSFGLMVNALFCPCSGIPVVFHSNPNEAYAISRIVNSFKATVFAGTPTFFSTVMNAAPKGWLKSLRMAFVGAEKCPDAVYEKAGEIYPNIKVVEGYGITECSPAVAANSPENPVAGTIGKLMPSVEGIVVNADTLEPVEPEETGLLLVRGESVFNGYYRSDINPFLKVDNHKWYNTGDLVSVNKDGIITFKGRLKRFVKIGGEMISLPAIEEVICTAFPPGEEGPRVAVETTDHERPELVLFAIDKSISREEVNNVIRDAGFSPLHNIRRVEYVEAIPLLGSGKTDYRTLKGLLI